MTVLVTGATGSVGRHLVHALLDRQQHVRAVSRNAARAAFPAEVDVVEADIAFPDSIPLDGVDTVFVFPLAGTGALIDRALAAGARRFVVLSSLAVSAHFPRDLRSVSRQHHLSVEEAVTSRTDRWAVLRPGTFANNLLAWSHPIRSGAPIRAPYLDSAQAPIHEADVADVAAALLTEPGVEQRVVEVTGPEALTRRGQIDTIAAAIGRPVAVEEISPADFRRESERFVPAPVLDMLLDYWRDTVDVPDAPRPATPWTGRPARTLAQWAADHAADFA